MRREFCQKGDIYISYTDSDVAFEDVNTAESILFGNDGSVIHNNFENDPGKTESFKKEFKKIYQTIRYFRTLDNMGDVI
jgi:hypothetical protein